MSDDVQKRIEELEARRALRRKANEQARDEQYATDLERVDALEAEHGDDRVCVLRVPSYVPGLPTLVVVNTPAPAAFNRFRQMSRKGQQVSLEAIGAARDLLASTVVLYPDAETYKRMREHWPVLHDNVGTEAVRLGEAVGKD